MQLNKIGIIGFGNFGRLLVEILRSRLPRLKIIIFDKNLKIGSLQEVASADLIFISVPISDFANVIKKLHTLVQPPTTIIDVCSVKLFPSKVMKNTFGKNIPLIATHPLFGPSTFSPTGRNKIVVCNLNCDTSHFTAVKALFKSMGFKIVETTPQDHDFLVARSQVFLHLVVRIANELGIESTRVNTKNFDRFLTIQENLSKDSWQLFTDMFKFNKEAQLLLIDFTHALQAITQKLEREGKHVV